MKKLVTAALLCAAPATPAYAQDADNSIARDGVRIEARATLETPTVSSLLQNNDVYKLGSAMAFGGEIGFDFAVSDEIVLGAYGQYEFSSVKSCDGTGFCVAADDYVEGGLHLGYAINESGQLYGKIGYGRLGLETSGNNLDSTANGSGPAFAIGYEHGLGENLYVRVEGGYADVGRIYGLNFQRRHFGASVGARF